MPPNRPPLDRPPLDRDQLLGLDDDSLLRLCRQDCFRASGPGGQHRNKTDSAVRLTVPGGGVTALCTDHRSQHRNRAEALKRLRMALAIDLRLPIAPGSNPQWQGPWKLGKKDRRRPAFTAHILDVLAHHNWAVGRAADTLGISTGKLIRTLARDPQTWTAVNQARAKRGLVNLRRP